MKLTDKKILIISPERWGINRLSKHHYAIALANRGNVVFFLNPPIKGLRNVVMTETETKGLTLVDYSQTIKGLNQILLKFPALAHLLSGIDRNKILDKLSVAIDIVWSFDPFRFQNLKLFRAAVTIFHPVDYFLKSAIDLIPAQKSDIIFSVAQPILDRYKSISTPSFLIPHGVSSIYLKQTREPKTNGLPLRCGYIGNLLSFGIHWENLTHIVNTNPEVEFHFIGPYSENNLGASKDSAKPLAEIRKYKNAYFHGELTSAEIAKKIQAFDLFLICYHPERVGSVVSNTHKVLEYLSTGKVVVSSNMSSYDTIADGLFEMVTDSRQLPSRFRMVIENISFYNAHELQAKRVEFARFYSYENHLQTIEHLISQHVKAERNLTQTDQSVPHG